MPQDATQPEPPRRALSLRLKLTLWTGFIFLIVQLSMAFVFQLYVRRAIEEFFSERLMYRVNTLAASLPPNLPNVTSADLAARANLEQKARIHELFVIDVLDEQGAAIASSHPPGRSLQPELLARARMVNSTTVLTLPSRPLTDESVQTEPVRAALKKVAGEDGRAYFVVLASSDNDARAMHAITTRLILGSVPISLIPILLSAYLVAGIAVRPFADIRALAQRLSPETIGQLIESSSTSFEVTTVRKELELARQRLAIGFESQERFLSNVSHELKTPIATVLTEVQALSTENAPQPIKDFLRSMTDELEKLGRTVDNFLLLTRMRHGKEELPNADRCLLREVLVESYSSCAAMAQLHQVRINLHVPEGDDSEATVTGNCDLLRVVFDNIIRNAIRFSAEGSVIDVSANAKAQRLQVVIRDQGPGIPQELLPRVFERFTQAKAEERRGRGSGLGLQIALGIAELHGGTITVRNHPEGGCEFTVDLPRADTRTQTAAGLAPDATCCDTRTETLTG